MSTFNTRRDRDKHGKAKGHYLVQYPSQDGSKYIHHADHRGDNAPSVNYSKNPAWWDNLYTTRRRRTDDRLKAVSVLRGADPDGIAWFPNKRPGDYYW